MELLSPTSQFRLYDPNWVIHTRSYERPPVFIHKNAKVENCLISDGCIIEENTLIQNCVLSPGVHIRRNAVVKESILFTDSQIQENTKIYRCIADKRVMIGKDSKIGLTKVPNIKLTLIGKDSMVPEGTTIQHGAIIGADVIESDYHSKIIKSGEMI